MPKDAEEKALQELKRLESMPPMSAEATVSRNYLDWLIAVPWTKKTRERKDLSAAEKILNEDHFGLEKVKERIVEFLAVRQLVNKPKGPILCFVGPPGVGKTSLAKSIARATDRKFVRLSLGGVRDEAEIRGHRRTYIGAFPGQIIQMMRKAGAAQPGVPARRGRQDGDGLPRRPVGGAARGARPGAEPHLPRPLPRHRVRPVDVIFIATANVLHTIPQALQDRMEVIRLPGYTEHEKIEIAKRHLIPKQIKAHGLEARTTWLRATTRSQELVRRYTREAGVRNLEREMAIDLPQGRAQGGARGQGLLDRRSRPRTSPTTWACRATARLGRRSATRSGSPRAWPGPRSAARSCRSR